MFTLSALTLSIAKSFTKVELNFNCQIALETLPLLDNKKFTFAAYINELETQTNFLLAKKTLQNRMSIAKKIQNKFAPKMIELAEKNDEKTTLSLFASFILAETKKGGYTVGTQDFILFLDGKPSLSAQKASAKEAALNAASAPVSAPVVDIEPELELDDTPVSAPVADMVADTLTALALQLDDTELDQAIHLLVAIQAARAELRIKAA